MPLVWAQWRIVAGVRRGGRTPDTIRHSSVTSSIVAGMRAIDISERATWFKS